MNAWLTTTPTSEAAEIDATDTEAAAPSRTPASDTGNSFGRWLRLERYLLVILALTFGLLVFLQTKSQPAYLLNGRATNLVFDADIPQVFQMMRNRKTVQNFRTQAHPLFPLVTYPVVRVLSKLGISPLTAVGVFNGGIAALWFTLLYVTLRRLGCYPTASFSFTLLGAVSASSIYFLTIPETYGLSSLTLLIPLLLTTGRLPKQRPDLYLLAASALSLSVTVTNWLAGLLATVSRAGWRQSVQISANALAIIALLTAVQARLFLQTHSFLEKGYAEQYAAAPSLERVTTVASSFFFHTLIAPAWNVTQFDSTPANALTVQASVPGSATHWGSAAVVIWFILLMAGTVRLFRDPEIKPLRFTLGGLVVLQFILHCFFGKETFLYSLHFLPLLVILAACCSRARTSRGAVALCLLLVGLTLANNLTQLQSTRLHLRTELQRLAELPQAALQ